MNKTHLTAVATTALIAISGVAAGGAQAATNIGFSAHPLAIGVRLEPGPPLSPMSQSNAIRKAQQYLEMTAYSRQGSSRNWWRESNSRLTTQRTPSTASMPTGISRRQRKRGSTSK